jgi:hypothetical protein
MKSTTGISTAPHSGVSAKRLALGFVAGFVSVLVFHQLMLGLLHVLGVTPGVPYKFNPVPPLGVPAVISSAFWGGLWGILFALLEGSLPRRGGGYWLAALLFGAIFPTFVFWFIVAPLKGAPIGGGWKPAGIATGLLVNGAWGIGTALLLRLLASAPRRA